MDLTQGYGVRGDAPINTPPDFDVALKREDNDRWLITLVAPQVHRKALQILALFAIEIERIPSRTTTLPLREIRYKWWQMQIEGTSEDDALPPLISALRSIIRDYNLTVTHLLDFIEAHWDEDAARGMAIYFELNAHIYAGKPFELSPEERSALIQVGYIAAALQHPSPDIIAINAKLEEIKKILPSCTKPIRAALLPIALHEEDLWSLAHPTGLKARLRRAFRQLRRVWRVWRTID